VFAVLGPSHLSKDDAEQDGNLVKFYHVAVTREDPWYVGRVLERNGVTAQGRTLDELVSMLRDAIESLWAERNVQLELVLEPHDVGSAGSRPRRRRVSA
jgi:predicted RNase H-like HicB family nuclease